MRLLRLIGLPALLVVALVVGVISWPKAEEQAPPVTPVPVAVVPSSSPSPAVPQMQTVTLLITGDLENLVNDPAFQTRLRERHRLIVKYRIMSDREMQDVFTGSGRSQLRNVSAMWPSNEHTLGKIHAIDIANRERVSKGEAEVERETFYTYSSTTFSSPIVLYTSPEITDAFIKDKIVTMVGNTYYVTNMPKLLDYIEQGKEWKDLGLPYFGEVTVIPTDPNQSGVGLSWMSIVTTVRLGRNPDNDTNLNRVQPSINKIIPRRFLESDPNTLLSKYISQPGGAYPIIVGYEGGLTEYVLQHPESLEYVRNNMRVLYPQPTIFAPHPIITKDDAGQDFAVAVKGDPELRRIIWEKHGQRIGFLNAQNEADARLMNLLGIPEKVASVTGLLSLGTLDRVITAWKTAE